MVAGTLRKLLAKCNRSYSESFMKATNIIANNHHGPHPGVLAIVYTLLFNAGLYQVISFTGGPHFPGPWESAEAITTYFQTYPKTILICAFLQFGAAIPRGIFGSVRSSDCRSVRPSGILQTSSEMAGRIRFGPRAYRGIERSQPGDSSSALSYSANAISRIYLAHHCGIRAAENCRLRQHREIMIGVPSAYCLSHCYDPDRGCQYLLCYVRLYPL